MLLFLSNIRALNLLMNDIPHKVFIVGFNVVPHSRDKLVSAITYVSSSAFAFFFSQKAFHFIEKHKV